MSMALLEGHVSMTEFFLLRSSQARPQLKMPGQRELAAIASTCGPATILYVAKTSAYLLIQATATSMSTLALAAHQPVWSVWGLVSSSPLWMLGCQVSLEGGSEC